MTSGCAVGPRQFVQRGSVWTDQRYTPAQRAVQVKAFSPLYFELLNRLTGLQEALVLGDQYCVGTVGRHPWGLRAGPHGRTRARGPREGPAVR